MTRLRVKSAGPAIYSAEWLYSTNSLKEGDFSIPVAGVTEVEVVSRFSK